MSLKSLYINKTPKEFAPIIPSPDDDYRRTWWNGIIGWGEWFRAKKLSVGASGHSIPAGYGFNYITRLGQSVYKKQAAVAVRDEIHYLPDYIKFLVNNHPELQQMNTRVYLFGFVNYAIYQYFQFGISDAARWLASDEAQSTREKGRKSCATSFVYKPNSGEYIYLPEEYTATIGKGTSGNSYHYPPSGRTGNLLLDTARNMLISFIEDNEGKGYPIYEPEIPYKYIHKDWKNKCDDPDVKISDFFELFFSLSKGSRQSGLQNRGFFSAPPKGGTYVPGKGLVGGDFAKNSKYFKIKGSIADLIPQATLARKGIDPPILNDGDLFYQWSIDVGMSGYKAKQYKSALESVTGTQAGKAIVNTINFAIGTALLGAPIDIPIIETIAVLIEAAQKWEYKPIEKDCPHLYITRFRFDSPMTPYIYMMIGTEAPIKNSVTLFHDAPVEFQPIMYRLGHLETTDTGQTYFVSEAEEKSKESKELKEKLIKYGIIGGGILVGSLLLYKLLKG